jgi:hypothetical protein
MEKLISVESENIHWKIIKQHWIKNRKFFNLIFRKSKFPLKMLKMLEKRNSIDLNLIFSWKKTAYINLCSTIILQKNNLDESKNSFCRISLLKRPSRKIYFIEKRSGCICCSNEIDREGPIWWDEWKNIITFFNLHSDKILFINLYKFSILENLMHFSKKKFLYFKKTEKIFSSLLINLNLFSILKRTSFITFSLELNKKWIALY